MPYDDAAPHPPATVVAPSAAIELSWLVATCHRDELAVPTSPKLLARADDFWRDDCGLGIEVLVIAQQLGCLRGWDITPLFTLGDVRLTPPSGLTLESETPEDRALTIARLERLARDRRLRTGYAALRRELWAPAEPVRASLAR